MVCKDLLGMEYKNALHLRVVEECKIHGSRETRDRQHDRDDLGDDGGVQAVTVHRPVDRRGVAPTYGG
jgi:hypothetical protein